jgi:trans-2-enoyl-CoA reductase
LFSDDGHLITYGGMSRKPVSIPTGRLIFNNIHLHGFWLSRWTEQHGQQRTTMLNYLIELIRKKQLHTFVEEIPFDNFNEALIKSRQGFRDRKIVLTFPK